MSLESNIKDIVASNPNYTELEKEFLLYYWETLRKDYLSTIKYNNIWLPHIGLFKLKYGALVKKAASLIKLLKRYKTKPISEEKHEAIREEFRVIWKHIQVYKKQFYINTNPDKNLNNEY